MSLRAYTRPTSVTSPSYLPSPCFVLLLLPGLKTDIFRRLKALPPYTSTYSRLQYTGSGREKLKDVAEMLLKKTSLGLTFFRCGICTLWLCSLRDKGETTRNPQKTFFKFLAGVSKTIAAVAVATAFRVLYWWRQHCKQISNGRLEIFKKIINLLTVTVLFLFTFFNLILDAPHIL